jgi:hypothetical protein
MIEVNAVIELASIDAESGYLTAWLKLKYGGGCVQNFGGYGLYMPQRGHGNAGQFIFRCMEIAGAAKWEAMAGRAVRVRLAHKFGPINSIGHIIEDDWFAPSDGFKSEAA